MMLRTIFLFFCLSLSFSAYAECSSEKLEQFYQTWKGFYSTSLSEGPEKISRFFRFPLKLLPPFDDEKPITISKNVFIKNYHYIFLQSVPGQDNEVFENFKQFENMPDAQFKNLVNVTSCDSNPQTGSLISVGDYQFIWDATSGWKIYAVDYPGTQQRNLKYSFSHGALKK